MKLTMKFDGGSRGNPGPAGAGAVLYDEGGYEVSSVSAFLNGNATNNQAEYTGLVIGLEEALELGCTELVVYGDSMLVVKQVDGEWKCKSDNIKPLLEHARQLKSSFRAFSIEHVYRKDNSRADELANIAMDRGTM
jgi:ribonuclease HI